MIRIDSEADFSKFMLETVESWPMGHGCRVESPVVSAGIPDLSVCVDKIESFIELKYHSDKHPAKIRPSQYHWMKKRIKAGGRVCHMCFIPDGKRAWIFVVTDVLNERMKGSISRKTWEEVSYTRFEYNRYCAGKIIAFLHGKRGLHGID